MDKGRQLARFYQLMSEKPFMVMLYRVADYCKNKHTVSVIFEIKGLEMRVRYQMYSSWDNRGLPLSLNYLSNRTVLPKPKNLHITEDIEDRLLELDSEDKYDFINYYFENILDRLKVVLKDERLSRYDLGYH